MADEGAIRIPTASSWANAVVFSSNRLCTGIILYIMLTISYHNIDHESFFAFEGNRYIIYRVHPKKLLSWPCWLADPTWPSSVLICLMKTYFFVNCLISGAFRWIQMSFAVMKQRKNWSEVRLNDAKHYFEVITRLSSWLSVSKRSTHFVVSHTRIIIQIETIKLCNMIKASTITLNFNLASSNPNFCFFFYF